MTPGNSINLIPDHYTRMTRLMPTTDSESTVPPGGTLPGKDLLTI